MIGRGVEDGGVGSGSSVVEKKKQIRLSPIGIIKQKCKVDLTMHHRLCAYEFYVHISLCLDE